ncbi:MAG: response regulator, partial [Paracoccaceae bacterium]
AEVREQDVTGADRGGVQAVANAAASSAAISGLRKMRILAAEDNKTNRLVFSKLVRKLNIELEFAENGRIAVQKWQSFQPDLVFMDISMPEMDGKQATREIRALEASDASRHTPIVALTAHAMAGDDDEIMAAGLDHYLTKPLRKAAIFERIRGATPNGVVAVFDADGADGSVNA